MGKKITISPLTQEELLKDAEVSKELEAASKAIQAKNNSTLVDESTRRRNEDWSVLASQVVGAEDL